MQDKENRHTAVVVEKTYDFLLWLLPKVEKFQRSFRFTVGDRMVAVVWTCSWLLWRHPSAWKREHCWTLRIERRTGCVTCYGSARTSNSLPWIPMVLDHRRPCGTMGE